MAAQTKDTMYVIVGAYDDVEPALADYEAVKALYREVRSSHDFDAAVIAKDDRGKVRIVRKHEEPTRHGAAVGLGWGLAVGVTAALFPPVGIGLAAAAGGSGAAVGGVVGHASGGMSRSVLKELGETLDEGHAGLIAVYATDLADQVVANVRAANRLRYAATEFAADQLADDLARAETDAARPAAERPEAGRPDPRGAGGHDGDRRLTGPLVTGTTTRAPELGAHVGRRRRPARPRRGAGAADPGAGRARAPGHRGRRAQDAGRHPPAAECARDLRTAGPGRRRPAAGRGAPLARRRAGRRARRRGAADAGARGRSRPAPTAGPGPPARPGSPTPS